MTLQPSLKDEWDQAGEEGSVSQAGKSIPERQPDSPVMKELSLVAVPPEKDKNSA